jgi:hypothetical protein
LQAIREALFSFEPKSKTQEVLHGEVIRQFNAMSVSEERLSAVSSSMPGALWYVVTSGSVLTIVFLWMIHMDFIPQIADGNFHRPHDVPDLRHGSPVARRGQRGARAVPVRLRFGVKWDEAS